MPTTKPSPTKERGTWLHEAEDALRAKFKGVGYDVPKEVRTSWGFPKGTKDAKMVIGQCHSNSSSSDNHYELFLSPAIGHAGKPTTAETTLILATLAHEIAHSVAGNKAGHRIRRKPVEGEAHYDSRFAKWKMSFPAIAERIGLVGPWTETTPGDDFTKWAAGVIKDIGQFPAGKLSSFARKKDTNRQLKCTCEGCGYIVRTTKKWIEKAGPPICPTDNDTMVCEEVE